LLETVSHLQRTAAHVGNTLLSVCTRGRPRMLERLLESLAELRVPPGNIPRVLVVENEEIAQLADLPVRFAAKLDITHRHVPQPGLAHARNGQIDGFLASDAQWLASFDDDAMVDPGWLDAMAEATTAMPHALILGGPNLRTESPDVPAWYPRAATAQFTCGRPSIYLSTCNLLLHRNVVDPAGAGLRFDNACNFAGGVDTDFLYRARKAGILGYMVSRARTEEPVHEARNSPRVRMRRAAHRGTLNAQLRHRHLAAPRALLLDLQQGWLTLVQVVGNLGGAALGWPFDRAWASQRLGHGLLQMATLWGLIRAPFVRPDDRYRTPDGH